MGRKCILGKCPESLGAAAKGIGRATSLAYLSDIGLKLTPPESSQYFSVSHLPWLVCYDSLGR